MYSFKFWVGFFFQARIQQKEETIAKYQELLKQARDDMQEMNKRHEQDLKNMQLKIHQNTDAAFNKFKEAARDLMAKQQLRQPPTEKQVIDWSVVVWGPVYWSFVVLGPVDLSFVVLGHVEVFLLNIKCSSCIWTRTLWKLHFMYILFIKLRYHLEFIDRMNALSPGNIL